MAEYPADPLGAYPPSLAPAPAEDPGRLEFGSCASFVAAVRVSIGGGRIGTACNDEVDDVVVVDREDEVDAFRLIGGVPYAKRGQAGCGGVIDGVCCGEAVAIIISDQSP